MVGGEERTEKCHFFVVVCKEHCGHFVGKMLLGIDLSLNLKYALHFFPSFILQEITNKPQTIFFFCGVQRYVTEENPVKAF